jgi:hypothetical protein
VLGAEHDTEMSGELAWEVSDDVHEASIGRDDIKPRKPVIKCRFTKAGATLAWVSVVPPSTNACCLISCTSELAP